MSESRIGVIDRTIHDTNQWLKDISDEMGDPDRQMAYHALRGVFFALRDRITPDESAHFAAQLPLLVRGIFYEGYRPSRTPEKSRDGSEWLKKVKTELDAAGGENPEKATRAVFAVVSRHVTSGELEDVFDMLPEDVRALRRHESAEAV